LPRHPTFKLSILGHAADNDHLRHLRSRSGCPLHPYILPA
jgi:hypothetical protein